MYVSFVAEDRTCILARPLKQVYEGARGGQVAAWVALAIVILVTIPFIFFHLLGDDLSVTSPDVVRVRDPLMTDRAAAALVASVTISWYDAFSSAAGEARKALCVILTLVAQTAHVSGFLSMTEKKSGKLIRNAQGARRERRLRVSSRDRRVVYVAVWKTHVTTLELV